MPVTEADTGVHRQHVSPGRARFAEGNQTAVTPPACHRAAFGAGAEPETAIAASAARPGARQAVAGRKGAVGA